MRKITLAIIGVGNISKYHISAINNLNQLYTLVGAYDTNATKLDIIDRHLRFYSLEKLLQQKPDCCITSTPSNVRFDAAKPILESGISVLLEQPFVTNINQLNILIDIATSSKCLIHGASHARYPSGLISVINDLEILPSGTFHKKMGKLTKIMLNRFDPYIQNNRLIDIQPEKSSGEDSWSNILSELDLYVRNWSVEGVSRETLDSLQQLSDISTHILGAFLGGNFEGNTSWVLGKDQKDTTLIFENGIININHTDQINSYNTAEGNYSKSFFHIGDRMETEYFRLYLELYQVLNRVIPTNLELISKIVKTVDYMLKNDHS